MQELASCDAEDARLSGDGYWVVRYTSIAFSTPVALHTTLQLSTYGIGFSRIAARRGYEAHLTEGQPGEPVISAHTLWVYVDQQGRPRRLPEETAQIWLPDGSQPLQADPPFPPVPEALPATMTTTVRFSDIDLAEHLNNASAVELLDNATWEACAAGGLLPGPTVCDILSYDIAYLDSPRFGEGLTVQTWLEPFPLPGQAFTCHQQILRADKIMVRATSRWYVRTSL
jgi:acyl-CoA thioesterase FadM